MGTGHLKRCLSLAQALVDAGAQVVFVCRPLDGVAASLLFTANVVTRWLSVAPGGFIPELDAPPHSVWAGVSQGQDAQDTIAILDDGPTDWLVVDHYAFDARWHQAVRGALGCRLVVIDDIADRLLSADALLDHNWAVDYREKYAHRLVIEPHWLTGPQFALLDTAYRNAEHYAFSAQVRSLGIFMGGTDLDCISAQVLAVCREQVGFTGLIEVVSTSGNPHLSALRAECARWPNTSLTLDLPNLARFFARHDLQIGAGGGATWERCCIGVPSILVALAANQISVLNAIDSLGLASSTSLSPTELAGSIRKILADPTLRLRMSRKAVLMIDGRGAERAASYLVQGA